MLVFGRQNRKLKKLGMCFRADDGADGGDGAGAGGAGGGNNNDSNNANSATDSQKGDENKDAKFTQDDVNKLLQTRVNEMNTKHEKELADLKAKLEREAELAKMSENDRIKAELDDYKKKFQEAEDKNALAVQTEATRKMLEDAKVPTSFLKFVLVPKDEKQTQLNVNELKTVFEAEVKKGVEAQIKPHKPNGNTNTNNGNEQQKHSGPSYSGLSLQNSIEAYYNKN